MPASPLWANAATTVARLIFAGVFALAVSFKLMDIHMTASQIESVGLPFPLLLACSAAVFELALVLAFLTGAFMTEAALLAAAYVLFLAFSFHGPGTWSANPMEFGFFVDHFSFVAGLLFAAAYGPGVWALKLRLLPRRDWARTARA
jgi:uncharacterized membrane protein YphA (DoxX/SURF4 family)